jgi:putative ABC transport system permease protein
MNMHNLIYLKEAILCLKANRLRSFLALLGLLIGTASVVALVTIGFLAKQAAIEQFKNLGTQKLLLHINSENKDELVRLNDLLISYDYKKSYTATNNKIFNPKLIANYHPITTLFKTVYYSNNKLSAYQLGIENKIQNTLKLNVRSGRLINSHDYMRYFVVLGEDVVNKLYKEYKINISINDHLVIDNHDFTVIGILEHWPIDPLFSHDINRSILMPISTAQYINNNYNLNEIYFDVNPQIKPIIAENYLSNLFKQILSNSSLQFSNAEQILEQIEKQGQILTILLGTIGAISLLVGAIGVMNIMLVAIVERKSEIGLRMAIGATPSEIKLQFLFETICLTSIGGLLGTILGIFIPYIITILASWSFTLPLSSIIFGLTVSLGVGLVAGFYPAIKASRMLPVACLSTN